MFLILSMIAFLSASIQPEWAWNMHPESGFKILSPIKLEEHVTEVPTDTRVITLHQFRGGAVGDTLLSMAFIVDYYVLPEMSEPKDDAYLKAFFENTLDPVLAAVSGTLTYMDIQQQADRDICSWKATYRGEEGVVKGNCILTHGKYYGIQVFGLSKYKPESQMNKFIDSFKLL